jgi:plasmid stabilization system protein ParE
MAQIDWTREAQIWLRDIYEFIAADNPRAAASIIQDLHSAALQLREHPRLGRRYEHIPDREIRILVHDHYRIAYLIRDEQENIDIPGVFHFALPIERYLL